MTNANNRALTTLDTVPSPLKMKKDAESMKQFKRNSLLIYLKMGREPNREKKSGKLTYRRQLSSKRGA